MRFERHRSSAIHVIDQLPLSKKESTASSAPFNALLVKWITSLS
jgi:hypothetical protein